MSLTSKNLIILCLILIVTITPLIIKQNAGFGGADGEAEGIIKKMNSDYEPWFSVIWSPPSGEIESLLFALQAALGAGFLGYYIGSKRAEAKYKDESE
ncbi:energy-coupling factor ABC transporter substrate-binding protein [Acetohalobium arabaticum]|uniref:Cobalt transport protein CbiN n=1 Tax=Acetohalobium arabaticum (strain ATCC 49924 / DSM 5501 / Z-7288) TaxID=574087 RepID=D9QVP7_ACEAZ|nr:energy-coupling factor ABC transporter substrate-binding protein [Acetohalobium arabaticum]ADL12306.1 Cobalt transport protein CbiN [Acetohalobium arabaticum DSM 5501]